MILLRVANPALKMALACSLTWVNSGTSAILTRIILILASIGANAVTLFKIIPYNFVPCFGLITRIITSFSENK